MLENVSVQESINYNYVVARYVKQLYSTTLLDNKIIYNDLFRPMIVI